MQLSISQIASAARDHAGLLSAESAAFLLLSIGEEQAGDWGIPDATRLYLGPGATVRGEALQAAPPQQVARLLRLLFGELLAVSVGTNPRLRAVTEGNQGTPEDVLSELRTALIPLNRSAARRALIRLHRRASEVLARTPHPEATNERVLPALPAVAQVAPAAPRRVARRELISAEAPLSEASRLFSRVSATPAPFVAVSEIPESVTPCLGSVALDEYAAPEVASVSEWEADPTALTDPEATFGWQTDGGFLKVEPRAQLHAQPRPSADREVESAEVADSSSMLTARFWALPPIAEKAALKSVATLDESNSSVFPEGASPAPGSVRRVPSAYLGDFAAATSDVNQLLREFDPALFTSPAELRQQLRDLSYAAEPSRTPPPVLVEDIANLPALKPRRRSRVALGALASAGLAVALAVVSMRGPTFNQHVATAAGAAVCSAELHVETEPGAAVRLVSELQQLSEAGPRAVFDGVDCSVDARVVVRLPVNTGEQRAADWLQIPVPQARLRVAGESGDPIFLRIPGAKVSE